MSEDGFIHIDNLILLQRLAEMEDQKHRGNCPRCNVKVKVDEFVDELSKKEFKISGTCQKCQNEIFDDE